jgi:hypothetical protein
MRTTTKLAIALAGLILALGVMLVGVGFTLEPATSRKPSSKNNDEPNSRAGPIERPSGTRYIASTPGRASTWLPPKPNAPLRDHIEDLKQQATNGNAVAACRLAFELDRCYNLKRLQERASRAISDAEEAGLFGDLLARRKTNARRAQQEFYEVAQLCDGVPRNELEDAWRYSLQAARAGHVPSMARHVTMHGYLQQHPTLEVLDGWLALRDEGAGYLDRAVEMGYREAYLFGIRAYARGDAEGMPARKDPALAMALAIAAADNDEATPENRESRLAAVVKRYDIAPADIERGRVLAPQYLQKLRERGPQPPNDGSFCAAP